MSTTDNPKPLSQKPLGYILAVLGGTLGAPLGWVVSPAVLVVLNKIFVDTETKKTNRFLIWSLIGIVAAPISISLFFGKKDVGMKISCMNEKAVTEWNDGSTQNPTNNLGTETFTWFKNDKLIEVSNVSDGSNKKTKVPVILNGTDLVFSANKQTSFIINNANGKLISTTIGDSVDGKYIMKMEGTCSGFK